ncbi:MAG TPA: NAD(P)H-hydrate dehydratase [Gemmatimonadaceae bacterium]|nr:NAD(P)H-hydrate dehydratase [Gemmatimonadaceae bacterium]
MHELPSLIRVVTSAEAAARDRAAIDGGIPSRALMQRAGAATAAEIALRYPDELRNGVLIFAGPGNNGGDAWVVARALAATGVRVRVHELLKAATPDAIAERALALPSIEPMPRPRAEAAADAEADPYRGEGIVIDGLLGTGASGPPRGPIAAGVAALRQARERGAIVVALDIPTGLDATSGEMHRPTRAHLTVTYGTLKRGHLLARGVCGRIVVVDIGLGAHAEGTDNAPRIVNASWAASRVPDFAADAHKGTRRKLAIVGGGAGMSGAVILATRGAWRSGVGMVKLVVAQESLAAVREAEPQSMTAPWPDDAESVHREIAKWADVVAIGPGLGVGLTQRTLVERVLNEFRGPVVLDADAINTFNADVNSLARLLDSRAAVLTPHVAEFGRLAGVAVDEVLRRRFDIPGAVARHTRAVVLLKGQPTIVTGADGTRLVIASGTPLLAAAGSGDVLTGMVATLLGQLDDPMDAAACAAYVHGRAAWLAQKGKAGARGLALDDVLAALPSAWEMRARPTRTPVLLELPDLLPSRT